MGLNINFDCLCVNDMPEKEKKKNNSNLIAQMEEGGWGDFNMKLVWKDSRNCYMY